MLTSAIDHLVVTAPTLAAGVQYVEQSLGCPMQRGGRHVRMGTHNALLRIGAECYLEVISIDPDAPPLSRARWFELDTLSSDASPRLATWVARTSNIRLAAESALHDLGSVEQMTRGSLEWLITIPSHGQLPFNGLTPALIQWQSEPHPVTQMAESSVSLIQLTGRHPEASKIKALLHRIGFAGDVLITEPSDGISVSLSATIQTPRGIVTLQ